MREVEIIKLGDVFGPETILNKDKKFMLIITDGGPIINHYNDILFENCSNDFKIQRSSGGIVQEKRFGDMVRGKIYNGEGRKGIEDGSPIVGESYTLDNSSWHTSRIERVIDDCIIITKNSVYAIHSISDLRDKKLNNLGIN